MPLRQLVEEVEGVLRDLHLASTERDIGDDLAVFLRFRLGYIEWLFDGHTEAYPTSMVSLIGCLYLWDPSSPVRITLLGNPNPELTLQMLLVTFRSFLNPLYVFQYDI